MNYLFTSESVTEGHPDKVADCISDAILDSILTQDPNSRVACETMITGAKDKESLKIFISGEITSEASIDYEKVAGLLVVMFQDRLRQLLPFQKVAVYFLRLGVCGRMILRLLSQNSRHQ